MSLRFSFHACIYFVIVMFVNINIYIYEFMSLLKYYSRIVYTNIRADICTYVHPKLFFLLYYNENQHMKTWFDSASKIAKRANEGMSE